MADQPVDVKPGGQNVAGEAPAAEPGAVTDDTTVQNDVELERMIGLAGGLAIGLGAPDRRRRLRVPVAWG